MKPGALLTDGNWFALAGLALCVWCGWQLTARRRPEPSTTRKALGAAVGGALALFVAGGYGAWCLSRVRASAPHPPWIVELGALTPQRHAIILAEYSYLQERARLQLPEGCLFTCAEHKPVERSLVERLIAFERLTGLCNADPLVPLAVLDPAHTQRVADRLMECMPTPGMRSLALSRLADDDLRLASDLYQRARYAYDIAPGNGEWDALAREVEVHWLAGEWQRAADTLTRAKLPSEAEQRRVDCARDALLVIAKGPSPEAASARLKAAPKLDNTCLMIAANLWPNELAPPLDVLDAARLLPAAQAIRLDLLNLGAKQPTPRCGTRPADFGALAWSTLAPAATLLTESGRRARDGGVVSPTGSEIEFQHCAALAMAQLGDSPGSKRRLGALKPSGDTFPTNLLSLLSRDRAALLLLEGDPREGLRTLGPQPEEAPSDDRVRAPLLISVGQRARSPSVTARNCAFSDCLLAASDPQQKPLLAARLRKELHQARNQANPEQRLFALSWARWQAIALDEHQLVKSIERSQAAAREHGLEWRLAAVLALLDAGPAGLEKPN